MKKKYLLNFTPTGLIPSKEMTPHVPLYPHEIIEDVLEAAELGANITHLHARNTKNWEPAYEKEIYSEIIHGIRKKNRELVICVSTSGRVHSDLKKRSECLELDGELKPDLASLTLSSLNFNNQASINTPQTIQYIAKKMLDKGIKPELEVFDLGMINYARYLIKKGLIKSPYYFSLILGNIACAQANPLNLGLMIKELPENSIWSAGGIGDFQFMTNILGLASGGGVRVGLEDNIYYDPERTRLATNRELIKRILDISKAMGLEPYSQKETREVIGVIR